MNKFTTSTLALVAGFGIASASTVVINQAPLRQSSKRPATRTTP
ncbi:MAG: hypothetical protein ACLSH6_05580 [Limosilactobacillus pontis]